MKAKIESAKAGRTFEGSNGTVQVYEVVAAGVIYDCLNKRIMELVGQEVEYEVKKASDAKYHDTMKLAGPGGQQSGGRTFSGKPFQIAFGQTAEGEKLRAKTMTLSYAKDMAVQAYVAGKGSASFAECVANVKAAFDGMLPLLHLDQIQEKPQQAGATVGNGHKDVNALLGEMKGMASLDALANWWKSDVVPIYNALSETDQKTLQMEKDAMKVKLTPPLQMGLRPASRHHFNS